MTGPAGCRLWGVATADWVETVDLILPGKARPRGTAQEYTDRVYRGGDIAADAVRLKDGIRVASEIRCFYDTYRYYGRVAALVSIESARWNNPGLNEETLLRQAKTLPSGRDIRGFRDLLLYSADTSMSPLETLARDRLLQAIVQGRLRRVETIEFQVGFQLREPNREPTMVWVDILINGYLVVEVDGGEKHSGAFTSAEESLRRERERETKLQNLGARIYRVKREGITGPDFIPQLQRVIDQFPGVKTLPGRSHLSYRDWEAEWERRLRRSFE